MIHADNGKVKIKGSKTELEKEIWQTAYHNNAKKGENMSREEAIKMAKADLKCMERDTSGQDEMCNSHKCDECSLNYERGNMGEQKEWLRMAIKALEQTQWIPISERLPEEDGQYLITVKYKHVNDSYEDVYTEHGEWYDGRWDMFCFGHCGEVEEIIAWMPLPKPARLEEDNG